MLLHRRYSHWQQEQIEVFRNCHMINRVKLYAFIIIIKSFVALYNDFSFVAPGLK